MYQFGFAIGSRCANGGAQMEFTDRSGIASQRLQAADSFHQLLGKLSRTYGGKRLRLERFKHRGKGECE